MNALTIVPTGIIGRSSGTYDHIGGRSWLIVGAWPRGYVDMCPKLSVYTHAAARPSQYGYPRRAVRQLPKCAPSTRNVARSCEFPHGEDARQLHPNFHL